MVSPGECEMLCFLVGVSFQLSILFMVVHGHVSFDDVSVVVDCGRVMCHKMV